MVSPDLARSRPISPDLTYSVSFGAACLADVHTLLADEGATALALAGARSLLALATRACKGEGGGDGDGIGGGGEGSGGGGEGGGGEGGGEDRAQGDGLTREALRQGKRKARFLEVWWASRPAIERRAALEDLRFGIKKELERREEVRIGSERSRR